MRKIKEYPSIVSILIDYQTHETETTLRKREEAQGTDSHESCRELSSWLYTGLSTHITPAVEVGGAGA